MSNTTNLAIDAEQDQANILAMFNAFEDIQEDFEDVIEYDDEITENLNGAF
jgi:hypothetical protein